MMWGWLPPQTKSFCASDEIPMLTPGKYCAISEASALAPDCEAALRSCHIWHPSWQIT